MIAGLLVTNCQPGHPGKLREIADADCRPLSQYINLVLKKHLEELDSK